MLSKRATCAKMFAHSSSSCLFFFFMWLYRQDDDECVTHRHHLPLNKNKEDNKELCACRRPSFLCRLAKKTTTIYTFIVFIFPFCVTLQRKQQWACNSLSPSCFLNLCFGGKKKGQQWMCTCQHPFFLFFYHLTKKTTTSTQHIVIFF